MIQCLSLKYHFDTVQLAKGMASALRSMLGRKGPSSLFIGIEPKDAINELYTLDLKDRVVGRWEMFRGLFADDKELFAQNMDLVNSARRHEAHTKPVTHAEKQAFLAAYSWLLDKLNKVPT